MEKRTRTRTTTTQVIPWCWADGRRQKSAKLCNGDELLLLGRPKRFSTVSHFLQLALPH